MKTRIYLFTGFLDSGKTSFIRDTIIDTDFCEGEKSLLLVSEQGEIEYNQEQLESFNCDIVYVTSVKNPASGHIVADSIGEIILDSNIKAPADCVIDTRK